ncbi:small ribosomal subunit protein uS17m [Dermacentor andersoni]|uniref:small ribosomal subunit protein uS17m n=1 Tax=Dermacentor andersoni TaxID=34620 RepID=UPI002154F937|nr:28S ribosomal protein S17, mitochondrial-like [Dermacentor andersoni]
MAAAASPALFLGKCVSSAVKKTVRVVVTRFELDNFLMAHYKKRTEYEALDANEECEPGDWVLVKELPERLSLRIAHKVEKIVYKNGNIIDPITGQKCIFTDFVKDVDKESDVFGLSPPYKAFLAAPKVKEISDK